MCNYYLSIKQTFTIIATKEMQIKTTLIYHCMPIKMPKMKNRDNTKCGNNTEKMNLSYVVMFQPLWHIFWQLLNKLNMCLLSNPTFAHLDLYLKEMMVYVHPKIDTKSFITALFVVPES